MARIIERPRVGLVCIVGLTVSVLPFGPVFAQADKPDRLRVDLDGDGRVSEIEELVFAAWIEHLPELAEDALAAGIPKEDGTLDVSTFLKQREAQTLAGLGPTPPIETLMLTLDDPCAFIRGDANRDGTLDLADVIFISNYIYGGTRPKNLDAADVNDDGQIDILAQTRSISASTSSAKALSHPLRSRRSVSIPRTITSKSSARTAMASSIRWGLGPRRRCPFRRSRLRP